VEITVSDDWISEEQFIQEVKAHGAKMTRRTARKWRAQRKIPYAKVNNLVMYPRDWASHLKLVAPRHT
jgi:hypothetical protein